MTDKERWISRLTESGLEPTVTEYTVQWSNANWSVIAYFDKNGKFITQERV